MFKSFERVAGQLAIIDGYNKLNKRAAKFSLLTLFDYTGNIYYDVTSYRFGDSAT